MNEWLKISLLLSVFGFLKEIRPSEPFINEFLTGPWRNLSQEVIIEQVYPVGTYSYLAHLFIVFLITDLAKYKPLIILLGVSGVIVWAMLLWTKTLIELQILEVFYGTFMSTEVAYYTYIYAKVKKDYYQQVTSHTRAAILAGRAISGILGQLLISLECMSYRELNYITFAAMIAATLWAIILPSVRRTIYFHPEDQDLNFGEYPTKRRIQSAFSKMRTHFITSFTNKYVVKWSLWWSLATCGFIQVQTYVQPLWREIQEDANLPLYNGAVEAVLTVVGFLAVLFAGVIKINWKLKGELILALGSLLCGFILLFASQTEYVIVSYVCYILFGGLYHFMITIDSSEIAKHIDEDSYGLVFGFNTFIALGTQSILTLLFVSDGLDLHLTTRDQYFVYGIYHIMITIVYIVIGLAYWLTSKRDYRPTDL